MDLSFHLVMQGFSKCNPSSLLSHLSLYSLSPSIIKAIKILPWYDYTNYSTKNGYEFPVRNSAFVQT